MTSSPASVASDGGVVDDDEVGEDVEDGYWSGWSGFSLVVGFVGFGGFDNGGEDIFSLISWTSTMVRSEQLQLVKST